MRQNMNIEQKTYLKVEKGNKEVLVVLDQDMPLGLLFDALMELKGYVVERMVSAQKAEESEAEEQMGVKEEEDTKEKVE